jgi:hypothetical protein
MVISRVLFSRVSGVKGTRFLNMAGFLETSLRYSDLSTSTLE